MKIFYTDHFVLPSTGWPSLSNADPYCDDRLGRLALSKGGLRERDRMVLDLCRAAGLPVAIVMAGGYARNIADTVGIHFQPLNSPRISRGLLNSHTRLS